MFNDDFFNNNEYNEKKFSDNQSNETDSINKKFMEYQVKFNKYYSKIKNTLKSKII